MNALDLADGFVGAAEYSYVADENGDIVIFADRTGIRVLPPPVTRYGAIQGEEAECRLWEQGKWKETHLKHSENNFHIMLHFLARPGGMPMTRAGQSAPAAHHMALMESFGGKDGVPPGVERGLRLACTGQGVGILCQGREGGRLSMSGTRLSAL